MQIPKGLIIEERVSVNKYQLLFPLTIASSVTLSLDSSASKITQCLFFQFFSIGFVFLKNWQMIRMYVIVWNFASFQLLTTSSYLWVIIGHSYFWAIASLFLLEFFLLTCNKSVNIGFLPFGFQLCLTFASAYNEF